MSKTYIVIPLKNKASYGVRVSEPNSFPDTVSGFATRAQAEEWIEKQRAAEASVRHERKGAVRSE